MMLFVLLTVFLCGLMVGRTPTYLGKRLGITEMKWVVASMLVMPVGVLVIGGVTLLMPDAATIMGHDGPHGLSRLIYAYASAAGNNGSAFGGLTVNGTFFTIATGSCMLIGRYWVIIPVLAIGGSLAAKRRIPTSAGTLPTDTPLFGGGLELASATHIRVAEPSAFFALPEGASAPEVARVRQQAEAVRASITTVATLLFGCAAPLAYQLKIATPPTTFGPSAVTRLLSPSSSEPSLIVVSTAGPSRSSSAACMPLLKRSRTAGAPPASWGRVTSTVLVPRVSLTATVVAVYAAAELVPGLVGVVTVSVVVDPPWGAHAVTPASINTVNPRRTIIARC